LGVSWTFLPEPASNCDPSDSHLPSSWDYRLEAPPLTKACAFNHYTIAYLDRPINPGFNPV
jgi:hypothetical protein